MNYADQQRFLLRSRLYGSAAVLLVVIWAAGCLALSGESGPIPAVEFGMAAMALAVFIFTCLTIFILPRKKNTFFAQFKRPGEDLTAVIHYLAHHQNGRSGHGG
jgi:hypothetical protein